MFYNNITLYQPTVRHGSIYSRNEADPLTLRYNHCVNVVRFRGQYYAGWNANVIGKEGIAGQYVVLSSSSDFFNWSAPVRMFADADVCSNPVLNDSQWQPGFINMDDEILFCAWCTHMHGPKLYIAQSTDGLHWTNRELPNAPAELLGKCMGFPTNRGFVTKSGRMIFPCSMPPIPGSPDGIFSVGATEYSALIMSDDKGETWFWSEPIRTADWSDFGEDPAVRGTPFATTWEPMVFDLEPGKLGLLVRNSTTQEDKSRPEKPHQMLFYAVSKDDGMHWTQARPAEVDTLCSRNYTAGASDSHGGLYMIQNDHPARVPVIMSHDRYFLSLFLAPVPDPDLFLPGPVLIPIGRSYYPDGFVQSDTLYWGASHGNIICGTIDPMPDYATPFLMSRESRCPPTLIDGVFNLPTRPSTLCLVLNQALTKAPTVTLRFEHRFAQWVQNGYPVVTLGGKTHSGLVLSAQQQPSCQRIVARTTDGDEYDLGEAGQTEWNRFEIQLNGSSTAVTLNGRRVEIPLSCLRKIAFGGLYEPPAWPREDGTYNLSFIRADSITLEG